MDPMSFDQHFRRQPELWKEMVLGLCRRLGLPIDAFEPFLIGSNLIAAVGNSHIVKIFPAWHRHQWASDTLVLRHLNNRLSVPTPECLGAGELENGWTWLVMSKLPGSTLEDHWPALSLDNKRRLLQSIGQLMAEVKTLPIHGLEKLEPHWENFFPQQLQSYKQRHERQGMPAWFLSELDEFVHKHLPLMPASSPSILLTGEYTPFNLMGQWVGSEFVLSGMIDFGDAMLGFAEYDLVGPSLFLGEGHPLLLAALFQGYGEQADSRRLMLLQILHRYSDFDAQLRIPDWQSRVHSIEQLEKLIWPVQL